MKHTAAASLLNINQQKGHPEQDALSIFDNLRLYYSRATAERMAAG